ncbi:MAG: tetratricopeptide repeat protein [Planctomycetota bacterium]
MRPHLGVLNSSIGLASAEVAAGRPGQAVSILERSLQAATGSEGAAVRLMLADLQAGQGRYRRAIEALEPAILDAGQRGLHPWLDRYLNWVVAAAGDSVPQSERITDKQTAARFDAVVHRYPNDPLALLRRLEFRQRSENQSRLLAEEEARTALELLANRIGKVSMDDLRPGAKRLWGAHLLSVSPLLAEEFARGQLDLQVGDIDAWSLLSDAFNAQGRIDETRDLVADLLKITGDAEMNYRYATLLALEGAPSVRVRHHLQQADDGLGIVGRSARSSFIQAQMELMEGAGGLDDVIRELGSLWNRRDQFAEELDALELGRTYLLALILRHQEADLQAIDVAAAEMLQYAPGDPYAEDVILAFRALAGAVRNRVGATGDGQ